MSKVSAKSTSTKASTKEQSAPKPKEVVVEQHAEDTESAEEDESEISDYVTSDQFDLSKFTLKPIEEKMSKGSQYLAFPKYKYGKKKESALTFVTDVIKLTKGGIPRLDGEYKKTDGDRMFFWLGCDNEQKSCVELFNALRSIDEHYQEQLSKNSDTKFVHLLKDKNKEPLDKLDYVALVRESAVPENAEKKVEPIDRIKVKFNTKYDKDLPEGQVSDITTSLFIGDREEPENLATVTDFEKYLRWNCEAKFVLQVNKFWAMKAVKNKKRECGLSIKCLQVYITKEAPATGMSTGDRFKKRLFGGPVTKTVSTPAPAPAKQVVEDDDDDTSEESQEVPTKPVAKQESTEEEDSDEEEDDEPAQAQNESEVSEESEEEEDTPPPPPSKKSSKTTAPPKKKQNTEESEESEEKPKPKSKGGKK